MKKIINLLGIVALFATYSCSSTYNAGNNKTDDVYYSSKNQPQPSSSTPDNYQNNLDNYQNTNSGNNEQPDYVPNNDNSTYSQSPDSKGNTNITNNYNGDYYDYEYSSRIRRFYNPVYGYNYYDPFYTNAYWYDYNPASWGVSIYLGYNWWAPSAFYYDPFCYGGFSVGFNYGPYWGYPYSYGGFYGGYNSGYYGGYGYPYNYGCSPYYGYGCNNGYYGNPNPYYYNSYDATSYYYGPRGSISSNSPRSGSQRQDHIAPLSTKYQQAIYDGRVSRISDSELNKSINMFHERNNTNTENKIPQLTKEQNIGNKTGVEKNNGGQRSNSENRIYNSPSKSNGEQYRNPANNSQNKNNQEQNFGGNRNSKDHIFNKTNPDENPNSGKSNLNRQEHNRILQDNNQNKKENQRSIFENQKNAPSPKDENNFQKKSDSRMEIPSRQENRTPVFTPRDQPKQYRQESTPMRSQPSAPAEHNNGGRRK